MPNNTPAEYYRHFKGNVNEFIGIAKDSEDPEKGLPLHHQHDPALGLDESVREAHDHGIDLVARQ